MGSEDVYKRQLGRHTEAMLEFRRAADLTRNERERAYLMGRAEEKIVG